MKKLGTHNLSLFMILLLFVLPGTYCRGNKYTSLADAHQQTLYPAVLSAPLPVRVMKTPGFVMEHLRKLDGRNDYRDYTHSTHESDVIKTCIDDLPGFLKKALGERLLGIYFIENFLGSGITEWAVDRSGKVYAFMAFNPQVLKRSVSDLLTYKENTCFKNDNPQMSIKISCDDVRNGFFYILLHESFHVYDYAHRITPYGDQDIKEYAGIPEKQTKFTQGIWCGYNSPCRANSFSGKVTFYGMGKGPRLKISDAPEIYRELLNSPFISLYSTMSWAEDFAEFSAFYHMTKVMNRPYTITVFNGRKQAGLFMPFAGAHTQKRQGFMRKLYMQAEPL